MTSRSATVLVIFVIAIFAFCFASVFAAMTGPISILPNESESGGILDNLSAFTDDVDTSENSYGYQDYSNYGYSDSSDDSNVETTTEDTSSSSASQTSNVETTTDTSQSSSSGSNSGSNGGSSSGNGGGSSAIVETTVDTP